MKPFEELTFLGKMRRMRKLAKKALSAYGLENAEVKLISPSGNIIFRVYDPKPAHKYVDTSLYYPNQYVLRLHQPDYQTQEAIESEIVWMAALRSDKGLPVPEPISTLEDQHTIEVSLPGVPQSYRCSLLRWMKGRFPAIKNIRPKHMQAMGTLMAQLHQHAAVWQPTAGFTRPIYDWEGLYGNNSFSGVTGTTVQTLIPEPLQDLYLQVTGELKKVMEKFGKAQDAFGLIHADLALGHNVPLSGGKAFALDFDDCAFGYWMFDIGVSIAGFNSDLRKEGIDHNKPEFLAAFFKGYAQVRSLPEDQLTHLDLFMAAWHAFEIFWAAADAYKYPNYAESAYRWIERAGKDLMICMEGR